MKIRDTVPVFFGLVICCYKAYSQMPTGLQVFPPAVMISVQTGLKTANAFAENLAARNFLNAVKSMASSIAPFLSVIGSLLSIYRNLKGNKSPSPELQAIKKLYETVNARFDNMETRFKDIQNEIQWGQAIAPVLDCEIEVRTLLKRFQDLFQNPPPDVEGQRNILLERYNSKCSDSLYYSIINDTGIQIGYSTNIVLEGMVHLAYDRTKIRNFMISLVGMMYKAATLDLIFINFRTPLNYNYTVMQWTKRFEEIQKKMLQTDNEVVSHWYFQAEEDVKKITSENISLNNKNLMISLYHFLTTKYYWRDWLVVVYNPIIGGDAHHVWECGGFYKPRYYNRNLLISSVDKSKPPINKNIAQSKINSLSKTCRTLFEQDYRTFSNAGTIFSWFSPDVKTQCSPFASAGVIGIGHDVWYQAPNARFILRDLEICRYHIHMFG